MFQRSENKQRHSSTEEKTPSWLASTENRTGMPDILKSNLESMSGLDMSDLRVHRNSDMPKRMGAAAFAQGTDIHLGPGQEQHLGHEAWHVVQQKQGRVRPTMQFNSNVRINDDTSLEKEADIMGAVASEQSTPSLFPKSKLSSAHIPSPVTQGVFTYKGNPVSPNSAHEIQRFVRDKTGNLGKWASTIGKISVDPKATGLVDWLKSKGFSLEQRRAIYAMVNGQSIEELETAKKEAALEKGGKDGEKYTQYLEALKRSAFVRIEEALKYLEKGGKFPNWLGMHPKDIMTYLLTILKNYERISVSLHDAKQAIGITSCKPDGFPGMASPDYNAPKVLPAITIGDSFLDTLNPGHPDDPSSNFFKREWTIIHEMTHAILGSWDIETFNVKSYPELLKSGTLPDGIPGPNDNKKGERDEANADTWAALVMFLSSEFRKLSKESKAEEKKL